MATAYTADTYYQTNRIVSDGSDFSQYFKFTNSTAFVINDTVALCPIPNSAQVYVLEWMLAVPALDSSTGVTLALGDGTTANAFMTTTATGQSGAGSTLYSQANGVLGYLPVGYYPATPAPATGNAVFTLKVIAAASGTPTSGNIIKGWIRMNMIGNPPLV